MTDIKYNKTLSDIKKEYDVEHLNFFQPGPDPVFTCSVKDKYDYPIYNALTLKFMLHRLVNSEISVYFHDLNVEYRNLCDLRKDSIILILSDV
jgi:hypothetical protein